MSAHPPVSVLIVGAGLGGLTLGIILERIGIDYHIFERASSIKPLGSAISLSSNIGPMFQQLGIYDELLAISKGVPNPRVWNEHLEVVGVMDSTAYEERYGYRNCLMPRPELYRVLISKIPAHRLHLGKRVLSTSQVEDKVTVKCSDGSTNLFDIVVGADGAYSSIRQSLYKDLKTRNKLPKSDSLPMRLTAASLVGTTGPLDPEKYPCLKDDFASMEIVVTRNNPYQWVLFSMPGNRICWMVGKELEVSEEKAEQFKNSGWSNEAAKEMCDEVRDFPTPLGGTMADFIDASDPALISKVMIEEKIFKTWYDGRIVLLGDSCHKMAPWAAMGAVSAMLDACSLGNCLNDLENNSLKSIQKAFARYHSERFELAKTAVGNSKMFTMVFASKSWKDILMQNMMLNWMPKWANNIVNDKMAAHRPQLTFLPFVDVPGLVKSKLTQQPSKRMATPRATEDVYSTTSAQVV